jgi:hypothetical protein
VLHTEKPATCYLPPSLTYCAAFLPVICPSRGAPNSPRNDLVLMRGSGPVGPTALPGGTELAANQVKAFPSATRGVSGRALRRAHFD